MLALLIKAFRRKLSFTLGFSVVRNKDNCITWAVHHKTNTSGGTSNYGYPDPTYFNRIGLELVDKGILLDNPLEV
jgi:deltex